ncbi:exodeoxyribonuclease V alpha subunit [Natranaerovirga hydrolytica]|uniref:ATP-dependent RecD2 DNA helicase n=1 Tax=Natranaerovirga hydrolytica TaxID=680378 RepID=A0A4R1MN68_9FIRM|nr:ATP-dependent RecD-like DNA helicase [Natranaerovirga hydrolytica]TCK93372.1 exodeoxyribonuclease V alpha subunit [Natranaerovirga hydrolytica]
MDIEQIEGYVEQIIYKNEENGYTVLSLVEDIEELTCVGYFDDINEGEYLKAEAKIKTHHTYGEQYQIQSYQIAMPTNVKAIEKYLSSGIIKGIGPSLAKKIVTKFKKDTFRIIEEEPERLAEIKGITEKKARSIAEIFEEKREMRQAMLFLQDYKISTNLGIKIYKAYGDKLYQIIQTNPYQLAEDIEGIGFKLADEIAFKLGIDSHADFRVQSGINYLLNQSGLEGHTYLPKEMLIQKAIDLLQVPVPSIENTLINMQINKQLIQKDIQGQTVVYALMYHYMELSIARKLFDLNETYQVTHEEHIQNKIKEIEKDTNIQLDQVQKKAVKEAAENGIFVITGGPGTGKTTTINTIIEYFKSEGLEVLLAAPTGRAAKRMTETTGYEAQTIHRLLEITYSSDGNQSGLRFEKNEDNPLEADVIIIDEMSMVDINIMHHLLKAIMPGTRLILVGDVNQLPSVGPGNILKDIINSDKLKVIKLTKIFRQAIQSTIVVNAHKINEGQNIELNNKSKDFFYIKRFHPDRILEEMKTLVKDRLPKFSGHNIFNGIQILTPMRKGIIGTQLLNNEIQEIVNPKSKDKQEKEYRQVIFREGDKIMQIKNNYQMVWQIKNKLNYVIEEGTGIYNGDMGLIQEINHYSEKVTVLFEDGKQVAYEFNQLDELELAYSITIHKSQGSEYPIIIIPILNGPSMLLNRNLLYTAVTRAKKYVILIGDDKTIQKMIQNEREARRYSSLQIRIKELYEQMEQ